MSVTDVKSIDWLASESTHYLACSHCIGPRSRSNYRMRCSIMKEMPDGRLKVMVFGERNWKNRDHIKHVRYVEARRVSRQANVTDDRQETKTGD